MTNRGTDESDRAYKELTYLSLAEKKAFSLVNSAFDFVGGGGGGGDGGDGDNDDGGGGDGGGGDGDDGDDDDGGGGDGGDGDDDDGGGGDGGGGNEEDDEDDDSGWNRHTTMVLNMLSAKSFSRRSMRWVSPTMLLD